VIERNSDRWHFVGAVLLNPENRGDIRSFLDVVSIALRRANSSPTLPCTLLFITNNETAGRAIIGSLRELLESNVNVNESEQSIIADNDKLWWFALELNARGKAD